MFSKHSSLLHYLFPFLMLGIVGDDAAAAARGDVVDGIADDDEQDGGAADEQKLAGDETDEPAAKLGDEDDKKPAKGEKAIPLDRHKAILERERAARKTLEEQLAAASQGQAVKKTNEELTALENEVMGLEDQYNRALIDGKTDEATKLFRQIRQTERQITERKAGFEIQAAEARAIEKVRYDTTLERIEEAYPQINPDDDRFDEGLAQEMVEMRDAYLTRGHSRSDALQKAVKYILKPMTQKQKDAVSVTARVSEEDKAAALRDERAKGSREKAAEAAGKQPPNTSSIGRDSDRAGGGILDAKSVLKMSQMDFAKLDEKELARMRGDDM